MKHALKSSPPIRRDGVLVQCLVELVEIASGKDVVDADAAQIAHDNADHASVFLVRHRGFDLRLALAWMVVSFVPRMWSIL